VPTRPIVDASIVVSHLIQRRISGLIALGVLLAIAGVLISPAVPSAPTLLPVSGLFLLGLVVLCYGAVARMQWRMVALLGAAEPTGPAARDFVSFGLPLRR
jgi:hypothetical protein